MILDGKILAERIKADLKTEVEKLKKSGISPSLIVIIVGNNQASRAYVNSKKQDCADIGVLSSEYALAEDTSEQELLDLIDKLNNDASVSGILVQLPLPKHINEENVINAINPKKDVDAFHPQNVGKIMIGNYDFLPCTPAGVMELIKMSGISIVGKECVVIGRSNIVGKPQAMLLLREHGTVTICHSRTKDLKEVVKRADIVVAAIGKAKFVTADMIKPGAVVIDVGMNRDQDGKRCGDVDFDEVSKIAGAITPVPGGVGPMTRAMLMKNTVTAAGLN